MTNQTIFYNETRPPWSNAIAVSRLNSGFHGLILFSLVILCIGALAILPPLVTARPLAAGSITVAVFVATMLLLVWGIVFVKSCTAARRYESQPAGVWQITESQVLFSQGGTSVTFALAEMTSMAVFRGFVIASFAPGQCAVIPAEGLMRADSGQPAAPGELAAMFRQFAPELPVKSVLRMAKAQRV